ncbi:MAG: peptidylprolyl isomerase [Parcubacteria group bacterium]
MENEQSTSGFKAKSRDFFRKIKSVAEKIGRYFKSEKFKKIFNRKSALILVCLLVILVCFFGIIGLGAYRLSWDNRFVNGVLRIAPYPAAIVSGHIVTLDDWREETKGVLVLSKAKFSNVSDLAIQQDVLEKLINDVFLRKLGQQFKVKVAQTDIDKRVDEIIVQLGSRETLISNIKQLFGWELKDFEKRVLATDILRAKINEAIAVNPAVLADAEKEANDVLNQLQSGKKTFEELAREHSADASNAANGGELGWFARGAMVKEFEDAAFALKVGETSGLVKTKYGYHIILLEDKKAADKKTSAAEQVKVKHILIAPMSADQYLAQMKAAAHIYKFVAK